MKFEIVTGLLSIILSLRSIVVYSIETKELRLYENEDADEHDDLDEGSTEKTVLNLYEDSTDQTALTD